MKRRLTMLSGFLLYLVLLRLFVSMALPMRFFTWGLFFDAVFVIIIGMIITMIIRHRLAQKLFYGIFAFFWTIIAVADGVYYGYFATLGSRSSLQGLTLLSPDLTVEYELSIPWGYFVLVPLFIGFVYFLIKQKHQDLIMRIDYFFLVLLILIQVSVFISFQRPQSEASMHYYESNAFLYTTMHDRVMFSEKFGFYYYHMTDLFKPVSRVDEAEAFEAVNAFFDNQPEHELNAKSGLFQDKHLIKITVESFDTRFIDPKLTPILYHMFENGHRFDNYYVPVFNQGATCNSEFMATTGLYAMTTNDYSNNICDSYRHNDFRYALPNQLRNQGYDTYYFHAGYQYFYNRSDIVPNYGFDHVKFMEDLFELGYDDYNNLLDTDMLHFLDEYIDLTAYSDSDKMLYAQFLTYGLHGGYTTPLYMETHDHLLQDIEAYQDVDLEVRVYMHKMIEFDWFLQGLIDRLQDAGIYDDTVFVIYTDHYPFMIDHDTFTDFTGVTMDSTELFQQSLIIFHEHTPGGVYDKVGATVDVTPTLLNLFMPEGEFKYFFGTDLFSEGSGYVIFHDLSLTDGINRYYLLRQYKGDPNQEAHLRATLQYYIMMYELNQQMLNIDYFRLLTE